MGVLVVWVSRASTRVVAGGLRSEEFAVEVRAQPGQIRRTTERRQVEAAGA